MADRGNTFPIYLRAEYTGDDPFDDFSRHLERATTNAKRQFGSAFREIETSGSAALSKPLNASGALNLDAGKMKAAADAASKNATALREVANAADRVAKSDPSAAFKRTAIETANAALVAEKYSQSVAQSALVLDRLQSELDQTKSATIGLASAQMGLGKSVGAQRQASIGAGQQLQDLVISLGSGQRASTVFAQQLPQLAFALSNVGGRVGSIATLFAGPWGVALAAGAFALGPLIDGLFKTGEAADNAKFASNSLSDAQGILGSIMDLTTGKINTQIPALIALANAQILVARVQAQTRAAEARRGVQSIQNRELQFGGGMGGGFRVSRRKTDARDVISQGVLDGTLDASTAVDRLENLRKIGRLTEEQFTTAAQAVANLGVELQNAKVFDEAEKLLKGTGGKSLLKPTKPKKTGSGRKTVDRSAAIAEFGEDTASKIAGIADSFGEAPGAIVRANKALRQLDDIQSDILRKKPLNIDKLLSQLSEARDIVGNSLSTAFDRIVERGQEQARIQELINAGREREADVLQTLASLGDLDVRAQVERLKLIAKASDETLAMADATADEREKATIALKDANAELAKLNPLAERQFKWAQQSAEQRERDGEAAKRMADQLGRYQGVVDSTYRSLEDLLSGGSGKDFLSSIRDQFRQLQGQNLADTLFGDAFAELRKFTDSKRPENKAVANLVEQVGKGSTAVESFADTLIRATDRISGAANDNGLAFPTADVGFGNGIAAAAAKAAADAAVDATTGGITVNGTRVQTSSRSGTYDFQRFADETARSIVQPLTKALDRTFGVEFFGQMSGAFSNVMSGFMQAGPVGSGINGLSSLFGTKSQIGQTLSSLSSQLPAIGQAIQLNQALNTLFGNDERKGGKLLHTVLGPVASLLFGKKNGSTTINSSESSLSYRGSGSYRDGVLGIGGGVQSSLANIIAALGGSAGSFGVSVGQRGKDFTVDPTGRGRTKGSGVLKFKDEAEAARAALADAIADGAVVGIRQGAQNLLRAGQDLEKQLAKAVDFQSVFDRLKQREDPLGYALDVIDRDFTKLRNIFIEASASAAEFADLQKLYDLERLEATEEVNSKASASLKDFLNSLTAGNDARSLRERQEAALKEYEPLRARVAGGDKSAYDDFAQMAQQILDIERQIYGSQSGYFTRLSEVTDLTRTRVNADSNVSMITDMRPGIFGSANPNNDTSPVVGAIMGMNGDLLAGINRTNELLQSIASGGVAAANGGGSRFEYSSNLRQYY